MVERLWRLFSIRKSYFLQVKSPILVGTLEKMCLLDPYYSKIFLNFMGRFCRQ
ncbi:hypothetical protein LBBP_03558 [Leptospira borgpetersenii serovar Ballum]|uniref:Uncharacterized protein n=1 Tax=Leptospira borgpetersenii serovar Ballum TaxID=280505 RepID=A0A0S2IWT0_LEPBO|nr:hypothetical protein LBBP_03558 [Leptospira borgpetersenii serovar Ballum]